MPAEIATEFLHYKCACKLSGSQGSLAYKYIRYIRGTHIVDFYLEANRSQLPVVTLTEDQKEKHLRIQ
jgi:hypothetical protein